MKREEPVMAHRMNEDVQRTDELLHQAMLYVHAPREPQPQPVRAPAGTIQMPSKYGLREDIKEAAAAEEQPQGEAVSLVEAMYEMTPEERKAELVALSRGKASGHLVAAAKDGSLASKVKASRTKFMNRCKRQHLARMREQREDALRDEYPDVADTFDQVDPEASFTLEIDRERCQTAWQRMSVGGELPSDMLMSLLSLAGQKRGQQSWVDDIMKEKFCGRSSVDKEDFWLFIEAFEEKFLSFLDTEFAKVDADDSGVLSAAELSTLLRKLGFTPAPWTVGELILEIKGDEHAHGTWVNRMSR